MKKKIVLVSSGQPSLNPRLVKEADALSNAGYDITVLYAYWNKWGTQFDTALLSAKNWQTIRVGGHPTLEKATYNLSRIKHKTANILAKLTGFKWGADQAVARAGSALINEAKKHPADLYIGHNLGALPAVIAAAKKHGKPCGFDAEDFHRNETSDDANDYDVLLRKYLEDKYFPQLCYLSVSSQPIGNAYRKLYPYLFPEVILNLFPKSQLQPEALTAGKPVKLFWFSQTIGPGRGLEDVIAALKLLNTKELELNLLGYQSAHESNFIKELKSDNFTVKFHNPVPPDEVISFASQFDIGLALEQRTPLNRDLCLTNKVFTYMHAGLAIIASDTTAQSNFMEANSGIGIMYPQGNALRLAEAITQLCDQQALLTCKKTALRLAQMQFSWEAESIKFLTLIEKTLNTAF